MLRIRYLMMSGLRFDIKYGAPCPGWDEHKYRSNFEKELLFNRWVNKSHKAKKLWWKLHND